MCFRESCCTGRWGGWPHLTSTGRSMGTHSRSTCCGRSPSPSPVPSIRTHRPPTCPDTSGSPHPSPHNPWTASSASTACMTSRRSSWSRWYLWWRTLGGRRRRGSGRCKCPTGAAAGCSTDEGWVDLACTSGSCSSSSRFVWWSWRSTCCWWSWRTPPRSWAQTPPAWKPWTWPSLQSAGTNWLQGSVPYTWTHPPN